MQQDARQLKNECEPGCKTQQRWTEKKIEDRGHKSLGESCKDVGGHPRKLRICDRSKDTYERTHSSWAVRVNRRKIILIEGNAKCPHLKNWRIKGLCGRCLSSVIVADRAVSKSSSCWIPSKVPVYHYGVLPWHGALHLSLKNQTAAFHSQISEWWQRVDSNGGWSAKKVPQNRKNPQICGLTKSVRLVDFLQMFCGFATCGPDLFCDLRSPGTFVLLT